MISERRGHPALPQDVSFQPYETGIKPGTEFCVFDVAEAGRFGVSICYDMWFPETTRTLVSLGAECILHPTMTDTIDRDVELPIARANATINQCYFFDINGVGDCGTSRSIVVGPSGYVIHEAGGGEDDSGRDRPVAGQTRAEVGIRGLGQTLKSFRDRPVEFPVYQKTRQSTVTCTAGPLVKPARASRAASIAGGCNRRPRWIDPAAPADHAASDAPFAPPSRTMIIPKFLKAGKE